MLETILGASLPLLILITVLGFIIGFLLGQLRRIQKELRQRKNMSSYIYRFDGRKELNAYYKN